MEKFLATQIMKGNLTLDKLKTSKYKKFYDSTVQELKSRGITDKLE